MKRRKKITHEYTLLRKGREYTLTGRKARIATAKACALPSRTGSCRDAISGLLCIGHGVSPFGSILDEYLRFVSAIRRTSIAAIGVPASVINPSNASFSSANAELETLAAANKAFDEAADANTEP
jgi:hypothetical protein